MPESRSIQGSQGLFLLLLLFAAGCSDTLIDPFENEGRYYTIYGYLDVLETQHAVRVIPVTRQSALVREPSDPQAGIDATVTSTELATGQTIRWTHNLEELEDGTWGHIYRANFRVQAGRTYRLDVERSDGITASAETTVPNLAEPALIEREPVEYSPDSTILTQQLKIPGVATPWAIEAIYLWGGGDINHRIYVSYDNAGVQTPEGDWAVQLNISDDQSAVRANIQNLKDIGRIDPAILGSLTAMGMRLRIPDAKWSPPNGTFTREVFEQPEALSNVVNGYGFWGSMGLYRQEWNTCEWSGPLGYTENEPGC